MASSSIRHLRRLSTSANPFISISKAMSQLRSEHDPDKALAIYSSVSDRLPTPTIYRFAQDLTVRRLLKSRRFSDIESLLESHKNGPKIKEEPYLSSLIQSYGRAGMFDKAMKTFEEMEALGTPRSAISFNALLSACNTSKLFDKVPELFDEIPKRYGLSPDGLSYGILVNAYCEEGLIDKAIETIGEIEKNGIVVNAVAFTTVIDALYKRGKSAQAEKLWETMVAKGIEVDATAYNVRIGHSQRGKPENLKALIEEMSNAGLKPDTITYNYLITCYCENGMIDEAWSVYDGLGAKGLNPNAATFRTMVYYLSKSRDLERGYKVFKTSAKKNKIPDFNTTRMLVEGLVAKKKIKDAKGMLRTIKKKFPENVLIQWKEVEERLGLASGAASKDGYGLDKDQEESAA